MDPGVDAGCLLADLGGAEADSAAQIGGILERQGIQLPPDTLGGCFCSPQVELKKSDDLPAAMDAAARARAGALFVMPDDPMMYNLRPQIVELAAKYRLPDFYWASQFVESGGLMSYGENLRGSYRATAAFMDRIKKGANPGDLPVEQPTRFELVINLKTAKALTITVPQSLLMRADDVIQ